MSGEGPRGDGDLPGDLLFCSEHNLVAERLSDPELCPMIFLPEDRTSNAGALLRHVQ